MRVMAELPLNDRLSGPFVAAGGQTDFPADFPVIKPAALRVQRNRAGVLTELAPPAVEAVNLTADGFTARLSAGALAGDIYHIFTDLPAERLRAHVQNGAVRTQTLEADAQELQAQLQETRRDQGRAVTAPVGEAGLTLPPAAQRADRLAGFDADGKLVGSTRTLAQFDADLESAEQARTGAEAARAEAVAATVNKLDLNGGNANAGQKTAFKAGFGLVAQQAGVGAKVRELADIAGEVVLSVKGYDPDAPGGEFSRAQAAAGDRGRVVLIPQGTYDLSFELGGINNWEADGPISFTGVGATKGPPGPIFQRSGVRNPDGSVPPGSPFYFGPWKKAGITTFKAVTGRVSPLDVSTLVGYSHFGHAGVTAFTCSADNLNPGYDEGGTAVFAAAANTRTDVKKGMYAGYFDGLRMPGTGVTHCIEVDAINMGEVVTIHPSAIFGGDMSTGHWVGAGGGAPGAATSTAAFTILNNGAKWDKGVVHHELAYVADVAQAFARFHRSGWYDSAGSMVAWDRSDLARRYSQSDTAATAPALTLARARDSGASASGDFVGAINAVTTVASTDTRRGGLTWKRQTTDGTEVALTGQNSGGYEFGLVVSRNGANSVDPTDPNLFALGGVNPWANIFTQNPVTVTSDARVKRDLGAPSEALLRAAAAVPIKLFQMLDAIAAKGEDQARIHAGVIAQEVKAAFEAEGLDPWRYGVLCADPWMETYEAVETVEEPVFKTVTEELVDHEVDAFGGVTLIKRTVEREVEDWNELPVFDEAGEPVWAKKASDAYALVRDETGRETASVGGESIRVRRVAVEPDMVEGENGVVRLVPARAALQATHRVRATRFVQKTVTRERQKIDDNGEPMERLSVRYEPLMMLKLAALAAGIGA
jgi:hypothetical protein